MSWLPETQTILIQLNWFYIADMTCTWGWFTSGTSQHIQTYKSVVPTLSQPWHDFKAKGKISEQLQHINIHCWNFARKVEFFFGFIYWPPKFSYPSSGTYSSPLRNTHGHIFGVFYFFKTASAAKTNWATPSHKIRELVFIVQPNEKKRHQICGFAHVTDFIP